jgi:hypothetical protein
LTVSYKLSYHSDYRNTGSSHDRGFSVNTMRTPSLPKSRRSTSPSWRDKSNLYFTDSETAKVKAKAKAKGAKARQTDTMEEDRYYPLLR